MTYPMCSRCVSKFLHCEYKVAKPLAAGTGSSLSFPDESLSDILDISDHAMLLDDTSFLGDARLDDVVDESFFEAFDNRLFQDPYSGKSKPEDTFLLGFSRSVHYPGLCCKPDPNEISFIPPFKQH